MKVRYRGRGVKKYRHQGKHYEIPSESWVEINNLTLFKKLKSHPDVFDAVSYFDTKPFELIEDLIQFKGNLIYTGDALAIRSLDKIPFVRKQAVKPEEHTYIYRIINYDDENLSRFADVKRTVNSLVFRSLGGIGDVLMTTPVIEAVYKRYPHFKITYSCPAEFLPLMENNPFIYDLRPFREDIVGKKWDVVTDLTRDCIKYEIANQPNVEKNRVEIFIEKCGLDIKETPRPKMFLSTNEILGAKEELKNFKALKIGLVLKSNAPVRNWPYFYELRERLLGSYKECCVLEFCKHRPKFWQGHEQVYPVFGRGLRDVAALINECDVVISPDTGLAHIASSLRVPTVWIFTHINGKVRTKNYDNKWVIQEIPPNCPKGTHCWYEIPCSTGDDRNSELTPDPPCSTAVEIQCVFEKVQQVLEKPNLSYVVVYKDNLQITQHCVDLIKENKKCNDELVLVDNGSEVNCQFEDLKKGVRCLRNEKNLGCIIGRNQGMRQALGRFILTLDNDQYISPRTTHALMNTEGDVVGVEGWSMDEGGWAFDIKDRRGQLAYVGGGGMLVKKKMAEQIGYLSEEYAPAWFSDPDFCFKMAEAGYKIAHQPYAGIEHLKHKTINSQKDFDSEAAWQRSHKIFLKKWHQHLLNSTPVVPNKLVSSVIRNSKPVVLFYMLSWLRYDYLIKTLESLGSTLRLPVYFKLRVQGAEHINESFKARISGLCSKFHSHEILYTYSNEGTAGPRKEMIDDFVENFPDIEYICLADDDVTFSDYSVEKATAYLQDNPEVGGVGIPHKAWGFYLKQGNGHRRLSRANLVDGVTYVDVLGSGHSLFRKEVFNDAKVDTDYFVGAWDWDLTFQISSSGKWKLVILNLPGMKSSNIGGGPAEYRKVRSNKENNKLVVNKFNMKFRLGKYGRSIENTVANN